MNFYDHWYHLCASHNQSEQTPRGSPYKIPLFTAERQVS